MAKPKPPSRPADGPRQSSPTVDDEQNHSRYQH
jgi:hypothetical protein